MRRRRYEPDAGNRMTHTRDGRVHLAARQLTALTGLGPLGYLDLQFLSIDEIMRRDAETAGSDLFDRAAFGISVRENLETCFIFPALTRIRAAADAVHGNGESFMCFRANGPERHCASGEALYDFASRFHLLERDGLSSRFQFHQP